MTLAQDIRQKAIEVGFVSVGISNPDMLRGLPHGWVGTISNLLAPEEELPTVKSIILIGIYAWDRIFNVVADSKQFQTDRASAAKPQQEWYQLYYEIAKNKAWKIADCLNRKGFASLVSVSIPLKTSAVRCGLGCQGKNTLLITPKYGPRVRLVSVLTSAELDVDEPFKEDLCRNCERCIAICPTKALEPYKLKINRCMTYSLESPDSSDVEDDVRKIEKRLMQRPTPNSYMECSICLDVCPIGKTS